MDRFFPSLHAGLRVAGCGPVDGLYLPSPSTGAFLENFGLSTGNLGSPFSSCAPYCIDRMCLRGAESQIRSKDPLR